MPQPIEIPPLREMKGRATARLRNEGRWARFSKRRLWYKDQLKKRNGLVSDALNEASWACALGEFPALKVGDGCDLPAGVEVAREAVSSGVEGSGSSPVAGSSEVGGVEVLTLPSALGRLVRRDGVTGYLIKQKSVASKLPSRNDPHPNLPTDHLRGRNGRRYRSRGVREKVGQIQAGPPRVC